MPTIGLELEIPRVSSDVMPFITALDTGFGFVVHDDGSIRQPCYTVDNIPFVGLSKARGADQSRLMRETRPIGLELVSCPIEIDRAVSESARIANALKHITPSGNASIHVHVDVGNLSYLVINNIIGWFARLEAILYRISSLGIPHRGMQNDYMYIRPLSAPIAWWSQRGRGDDDDDDEERDSDLEPIFNISNVLSADTATKMAYEWGRLDYFWSEGNSRYIPHRLHGLNPVPIMRQGTIEFRIFNGVYGHLSEALMMVRDFWRLAMTHSYTEFAYSFPLGYNRNVPDDVWHMIGFSDPVRKMFDRSSWPRGVENAELGHHYDRGIWRGRGRGYGAYTLPNDSGLNHVMYRR